MGHSLMHTACQTGKPAVSGVIFFLSIFCCFSEDDNKTAVCDICSATVVVPIYQTLENCKKFAKDSPKAETITDKIMDFIALDDQPFCTAYTSLPCMLCSPDAFSLIYISISNISFTMNV